MNSRKIETNSINKLKDELERCDRIISELSDNDRSPSLDGKITLYKSSNLKKENMQGIINVQIKGKEVNSEELDRYEISYPVEVADLRNFLHVGGVIFFVVCMIGFDHYKIYYNPLLPLDIKELFKNVIAEQKTKNIVLREFPKNNVLSTIYILANFIENSKKQHGIAKIGYQMNQFDEINFSAITTNLDDIFDHPMYLYGRKEGIDLDIPLTKVMIQSMTRNNIMKQVKIYNEVFYDEIDIEKGNDILKINFGAFELDITKSKLHFTEKGNLEERIRDFDFFYTLLKKRSITIDNIKSINNIKVDDCDLKEVEEKLHFYISLQKFLMKLNVKDEIDLDTINMNELAIFMDAILKGTSVSLDGEEDTETFWAKFRFSNLVFLVRTKKVEGKYYFLENLFDERVEQYAMKCGEEMIASCIYVSLKKDDFIELSNINYENMQKSLQSISYSKEYGEAVNFLLLEMLLAFDEKKNDIELLDNIMAIANWLYCQEGTYIYKLNHLQTIKRRRHLSEGEYEALINMKDDINKGDDCDFKILLGISILLENKIEFKYYFNKLGKEDQDCFRQFPIYTFAKDWGVVCS